MLAYRPWVCIVICFLTISGYCQVIDIQKDKLDQLIRQWNFAHNSGSVESFEVIYGDQVLYFTKAIPKREVIQAKRLTTESRQRITSDIKFVPYTSGVVKCDFELERSLDASDSTTSAYLLISYEDGKYFIVGEGDVETDRKLNYQLDIGEPLNLDNDVANTIEVPDSSGVATADSDIESQITDTISNLFKEDTYSSIIAPFQSDKLVQIPESYVYILIALQAWEV
jgi:hypothetical protein